MRIIKSVLVGAELGRLYVVAGREPLDRGLALLREIAESLHEQRPNDEPREA